MTRRAPASETVAVTVRPHWLPDAAWMGVVVGEWPLYAFPNEILASRWAAGETYPKRRRVWKVEIPEDVQTYSGRTVPATVELVED